MSTLKIHTNIRVQDKSKILHFGEGSISSVKDNTVKEFNGYYIGYWASGLPLVVKTELYNLISISNEKGQKETTATSVP